MSQFIYKETFVQTHGNLWLICNDCLRPSGYFAGVFVNPQILLVRSSQQSWCPPFSGANAALREYLLLHFSAEITKLSFGVEIDYASQGILLGCSYVKSQVGIMAGLTS